MTWDEKRNYDSSDLASVENRAWLMVGNSLDELDIEINVISTYNSSDRGWTGKVIHRWFTDDDNYSEPDLPNVPHPSLNHLGLEIKAVPLAMGASGEWLVQFPMSLAMINYDEIYQSEEIEAIEDSVIFRKDRWTLAVYYSLEKNKPEGMILGLGIWDIENTGFVTMMNDYYKLNQFIKMGNAHRLSETLSDTLSARRKGGAGQKRSGGPKGEAAKSRAWALKAHYVRKRLEMDRINSKEKVAFLEHDGMTENQSQRMLNIYQKSLEYAKEKGHVGSPSLRNLETRRIMEYLMKTLTGKTVLDVARHLNYDSFGGKDVHARVARMMLHQRPGGLGEKGSTRATYIDGMLVKVFTVDDNDLPTEYGLKMPHIPLVDLGEEEWEDCSLIQNLHRVLLIPVKKAESLIEGEYLHPLIWRPNRRELKTIKQEWEVFRDSIRNGKAKRYRVGKRNTNDLPVKEDTQFLHMRPAASDGTVTELDPLGNECTRMTLWLNDTAVQRLFHPPSHLGGRSRR